MQYSCLLVLSTIAYRVLDITPWLPHGAIGTCTFYQCHLSVRYSIPLCVWQVLLSLVFVLPVKYDRLRHNLKSLSSNNSASGTSLG